jgi:hypothetical protein
MELTLLGDDTHLGFASQYAITLRYCNVGCEIASIGHINSHHKSNIKGIGHQTNKTSCISFINWSLLVLGAGYEKQVADVN